MKRFVQTICLVLGIEACTAPSVSAQSIHCEVYVADSSCFNVTSTLISGEHEAILVDVQYHVSDAMKLAERVAASGKRLKAIFISHPHDDHYLCIATWRQMFPRTPVYMTAAGLKEFQRSSPRYYRFLKSSFGAEAPDSLPTPEVLPTTHLTVDGQAVEIVADRQGDEWIPSNSYIWIPSIRTIIAGDIVFNGVHVWLANSTQNSRKAWLNTLHDLEALHPQRVIAGHMADISAPEGAEAIALTSRYIATFDSLLAGATGSDDLAAKMTEAFPALRLRNILLRAVRIAIPD